MAAGLRVLEDAAPPVCHVCFCMFHVILVADLLFSSSPVCASSFPLSTFGLYSCPGPQPRARAHTWAPELLHQITQKECRKRRSGSGAGPSSTSPLCAQRLHLQPPNAPRTPTPPTPSQPAGQSRVPVRSLSTPWARPLPAHPAREPWCMEVKERKKRDGALTHSRGGRSTRTDGRAHTRLQRRDRKQIPASYWKEQQERQKREKTLKGFFFGLL